GATFGHIRRLQAALSLAFADPRRTTSSVYTGNMYGKGYGDFGKGGWNKGGFYGYPPWDGGKGMMGYGYGMMMPPMFAFKGKGKGKGKRSPQLNVDPAKKLWIGNIPEDAKWKDLQALVDKAGKSRWVEIFRGKGKGTGAVVPGRLMT
ncbi:unnamed protein product, partial [Effrenium voratum]